MDSSTIASDRLLSRIASGTADESAWRALVDRHGGDMRRAAVLALGGDRLVDDAVQEALLQLCRCAARFRPRGGEMDAEVRRWLQGLTVNCALELRRAEARRTRREAVHAEMTMHTERPDDDPWSEQLSQAMAGLSQDERQVLILSHTEGLDHHGLAAALGTNEAAARKRLSRVHERLRRKLMRAGCTLSLSACLAHLNAANAIGLPPAPTAAWIQAAHAGLSPMLPIHLATGGLSTMAITAIISAPILAVALTVGSVLIASDQPAPAHPAAASWTQPAKGSYAWNDAANWSAGSPNGNGAAADLDVGLQGPITVTLAQPVTLGSLSVGDTRGVPGAATSITGKLLTFEGAMPGAATHITLTQGAVANGLRLNLGTGIRLGGTSPLTLSINSMATFEGAIHDVDLNGNVFTMEGQRWAFINGNHWEGVNWQIGNIIGAGEFVQDGPGASLQGECPDFTGTLIVNNGGCIASRLPAVSTYVVAGAFVNQDKYPRGGELNLVHKETHVAGATWSPRLNPAGTLILRGGGNFHCAGQDLDEMAFVGALRPVVVEHLKQFQFQCGMSEFTLDNGNFVSSSTTLLITDPANALIRQPGATVMMSGDGLRTTAGYQTALGDAEKVIWASGMMQQLKGAGGGLGKTNRSIIPWMTVGTIHHPSEGGFATYDQVKGVYPLLEHDEYDHQLAGTPDRNVKSGELNLGVNKSQTINSLVYTRWGNSDIGAGSTLTVTSGGVMMGSMGGVAIGCTPGAGGTLNFGGAEGVVWCPFYTFKDKPLPTIGAVISGSGGLTKAGTSPLVLTAANTYTGRTCVGAGVMQVGNGTLSTSRLGDGDVEVASGATLLIRAHVANAISDAATVTLLHAGTAFFGTIDLDAGIDETVAGLILDDKPQPAGTYGGPGSAATHKLGNYFAGAGILTVTGSAAKSVK
jgi:RNA polymerase sigma factor (sigma-70 family)